MRARGLLVAAVLAVAPVSVWGECATPAAVVLPADGSPVPPKPVLFVFVPRNRSGVQSSTTLPLSIADEAGARVPFRVTRLAEVPAFTAYRVDVAEKGEAGIIVKLRYQRYGEEVITRSYSVTRLWRRPQRGRTSVTKIERASSRWTCSYQSSRNLTPSRFTQAYRVEWAFTFKDWRAGTRNKLVLPYSKSEFWPREGSQIPQVALLELGHLDCLGSTFQWKDKPIYVGVAALHPDGSDDPPAPDPVAVNPP